MNHTLLKMLACASLATLLVACDSSVENSNDQALERKADALEQNADTVRDQGESNADAIERADPGIDSSATDDAAEAVRESTENRADALEERSDAVRDQK